MANSKSAMKRIRVNKRNNIQNNSYKTLIKNGEKTHLNLIKEYVEGVSTFDQTTRTDLELKLRNSFNIIVSRIDRAAKKHVIHKNTAIRKKRKLFKKTFFIQK